MAENIESNVQEELAQEIQQAHEEIQAHTSGQTHTQHVTHTTHQHAQAAGDYLGNLSENDRKLIQKYKSLHAQQNNQVQGHNFHHHAAAQGQVQGGHAQFLHQNQHSHRVQTQPQRSIAQGNIVANNNFKSGVFNAAPYQSQFFNKPAAVGPVPRGPALNRSIPKGPALNRSIPRGQAQGFNGFKNCFSSGIGFGGPVGPTPFHPKNSIHVPKPGLPNAFGLGVKPNLPIAPKCGIPPRSIGCPAFSNLASPLCSPKLRARPLAASFTPAINPVASGIFNFGAAPINTGKCPVLNGGFVGGNVNSVNVVQAQPQGNVNFIQQNGIQTQNQANTVQGVHKTGTLNHNSTQNQNQNQNQNKNIQKTQNLGANKPNWNDFKNATATDSICLTKYKNK